MSSGKRDPGLPFELPMHDRLIIVSKAFKLAKAVLRIKPNLHT